MFVSETPAVLAGFILFPTGIAKAFAASGDITQHVLPRSNMHCKRKYCPSWSIKNENTGYFLIPLADISWTFSGSTG
jgi:hypothetical protein